jgi:hypothetical protein
MGKFSYLKNVSCRNVARIKGFPQSKVVDDKNRTSKSAEVSQSLYLIYVDEWGEGIERDEWLYINRIPFNSKERHVNKKTKNYVQNSRQDNNRK